MITGFSISNFKNLAQVPEEPGKLIPFGPLNVLIGPNSAGKSSLLQAIDFLRAFLRSSVELYLRERGWDYHDLPNLRQTSKAIRWELTARLDDDHSEPGDYRYQVTLQPRKHLTVAEEELVRIGIDRREQLLLRRRGRSCELYDSETEEIARFDAVGLPASLMSQLDSLPGHGAYSEIIRFRAWLDRFRFYSIWDPKVLRTPDRGRHDELGPSGEHLAALIGRLKDKRPKAFGRLVNRLRHLFPTLTDISVSGRGWGWRTIRLHEGNGSDVTFNSQQMSDGVLRLLAIASFLYAHEVPSVLMFEEPENGVHPQLIRQVVQILGELTELKPPRRCQVFLTTHSPYVLDEFCDHPEQVFCVDRRHPLAGATVARLSDNKQLNVARNAFKQSLGEAWTSGLIGAASGAKI